MSCTLCAANPPVASQDEVAHLFSYLASSNCKFYRNGSWYVSSQAADHLKENISTYSKGLVPRAEAFIERGATQSSVSGEPYLAKCGDAKPVPSDARLKDELLRYRSAAK
jgi:hypothetical protein